MYYRIWACGAGPSLYQVPKGYSDGSDDFFLVFTRIPGYRSLKFGDWYGSSFEAGPYLKFGG